MSENELGLTAKQLEAYHKGIAEANTPAELSAHMDRMAKLADENEVLSRADQIKSGRAETPDDSKKDEE